VAYCVKDGKQQDAEEFLGTYLDALDEELIELQGFISAHKLASIANEEGLEEGTRSGEGQTEVAEKDFMVRQLFLLSVQRA
jgi:hypothetical protein